MIYFVIFVVGLIVGACVGSMVEEWGESNSAGSFLDRDPGLAARYVRADIAADVRQAEEQIRRLNQPQVSRPRQL